MAALCAGQSCLHSGRATAYNSDFFADCGRFIQLLQLVLDANDRIYGADEGNAVNTSRIMAAHTFHAGDHIFTVIFVCFGTQIGVCQPTPGHGDQVRLALSDGSFHLIQILIAANG